MIELSTTKKGSTPQQNGKPFAENLSSMNARLLQNAFSPAFSILHHKLVLKVNAQDRRSIKTGLSIIIKRVEMREHEKKNSDTDRPIPLFAAIADPHSQHEERHPFVPRRPFTKLSATCRLLPLKYSKSNLGAFQSCHSLYTTYSKRRFLGIGDWQHKERLTYSKGRVVTEKRAP